MTPQENDVIIIGTGPGGLSAAYELLKHGFGVVIVDRAQEVGGLMRSVKHQDIMVDFGYKRLYNRIPEVQALWKELLHEDFYTRKMRRGVLYKGYLLEKEKTPKGLRRGMPYPLLIRCTWDMVVSRFRYRKTRSTSLAHYTYARRGRQFTNIFSKNFSEKNKGSDWLMLPAPVSTKKSSWWSDFLQDAHKVTQKQTDWYHPSKGTGQIIDRLYEEVLKKGARFYLKHNVVGMVRGEEGYVVTVDSGTNEIQLKAPYLVSSMPLQFVAPLMGLEVSPAQREFSFKRGVIMVYLFLSTEVSLPYNCIHVSSPEAQMSRITNYGAYGGGMVPKGKGCLCVEYFLPHAQHLYQQDDDSLVQLAITELEENQLLDRETCEATRVIRSLIADPAVSWEDYRTDTTRLEIQNYLAQFPNFYQINRTGIDRSTFAGLMAARAIIDGDREPFDRLTQPNLPTPWDNRK